MDEVKAIEQERKKRPRPRQFDEVVDVTSMKVGIWALVAIEGARLIIDNLELILRGIG